MFLLRTGIFQQIQFQKGWVLIIEQFIEHIEKSEIWTKEW